MIKTLLAALSGALLLAAPALHAQSHRYAEGHPVLNRAYDGRYRGYGYGGHHHYGRYYYFGGVPYFYPFYGFGYPGYYDSGWYGGFGGAYGYGYGGEGYGDGGYGPEGGAPGAYEGRIANKGGNTDRNGAPSSEGQSLPEAVQRQLAKKGYYKGAVDGQFGPASRSALSQFQREHNLKETGRIDEPTLDALGFTDHR